MPARVPRAIHVVAGLWIASMGLYGVLAPERYRMFLQEDRGVEWATVCLFALAAAGFTRSALRGRWGDGLIALFCLFVAGEEFSWGQRLLGYSPPEFFLANNFQQEANLHNIPQAMVQPKWILMAALAAYGLALPLANTRAGLAALIARFRLTPTPVALAPWFLSAIVLLAWYPLTLTGEWVEALAGGLFMIASALFVHRWWLALSGSAVMAGLLTTVSGNLESARDGERIACAGREVQGLVEDVSRGPAATGRLWAMRRVHKRLWSAGVEGYVDLEGLRSLADPCSGEPLDEATRRRRHYGVDPWGSPYWLLVQRVDDARSRVTVYSFGPNRRRDFEENAKPLDSSMDDIVAVSAF